MKSKADRYDNIDKTLILFQTIPTLQVKLKFRYPYFLELHWYALARYVACLLHADYLLPVKLEAKKEEVKEEEKEEKVEAKEPKKEPQETETNDNTSLLPVCEVKKEIEREIELKPFPSSKVR